MMIGALDQAPRGIGWAYGEPGGTPKRGYQPLSDFGFNDALREEEVEDWVVAFCKSAGIERLYFEQVIVRKVGLDINVLYAQMAVVCGVYVGARRSGLKHETLQVNIADWRDSFYHGRRAPKSKARGSETEAWKDMSMTECLRRGWLIEEPFPDRPIKFRVAHNIAEACGIWDHGCKLSDKNYYTRSRIDARRQQTKADEERRTA